MDEIDILRSIALNLSESKSTAALNNYELLCNNIKYVNSLLSLGVEFLKSLQLDLEQALKNNAIVKNESKDNSKPFFYFRNIIPRIISNDISIIEKFILNSLPDERDGITIENVLKIKKTFLDFNNLVTAARQFVDSLVSDAYQLILLEPKEINFHVLSSLSSFNKYVTKSIRQALFNNEIQSALIEFDNLDFNKRVRGQESHITKCEHKTFGQKVDCIFDNLGISGEIDFKEEIKNFFSFSSEFTHIGYVSTFFTSSNTTEVIFGDDIGPYLPSTENFSELKYEILETATKFYSKVYLPSLKIALHKIINDDIYDNYKSQINKTIETITENLNTRNNQYYFFIKKGLINSDEIIDLPCMCGMTNRWEPPHDLSKLFCKSCGSKFNLIEIEGDPEYIITSNGPVKVIGSNVPDFNALPLEKRIELLKTCEQLMKNTINR